MDKLGKLLDQIDGKGYKAFKQLQGCYQFAEYLLHIDHVQGDPLADTPPKVSFSIVRQPSGQNSRRQS